MTNVYGLKLPFCTVQICSFVTIDSPPDTRAEVIVNYFRFLEDKLDTHNFRVVMVGDFNTTGFEWNHGLSVPDCHYYSKLKGDAVYTSTCLLNMHQCIDAVGINNFLDLIFSNFSDIGITFLDSGIIKTGTYHNPLVIDIILPLVSPTQNCEYSYRKFSSGGYILLYNILSNYDWSCVYDMNAVDAAVASLNAIVQDAMQQAIPRGFITKSKYPHWFSNALSYDIRKNYFYRCFKKKKSDSL
jgi:hypothetical protein